LDLLIGADPQSNGRIANLEDDERPDNRQSRAMALPAIWLRICPAFPSINPSGRGFPAASFDASFTALVAQPPVRMAPKVPPAP
jgi:hypothetical protein